MQTIVSCRLHRFLVVLTPARFPNMYRKLYVLRYGIHYSDILIVSVITGYRLFVLSILLSQ